MARNSRQPGVGGPLSPLFSGEPGFVVADDGVKGIGKLVAVADGIAEIEYFISPAGPRTEIVSAATSRLRWVELPAQTRVYWFDHEQHAWRIGRVDGGLVNAQALGATEDHYHVRFPNREDGRIPCSQLYVRWALPIDDPTDHLAARITDSPLFYDDRRRIVAHLARQRAAFGGITGIASSAIEFFEHQVSITRRVLADPVERYLLADEVGLGKTIEAGILIRQHVLDRPSTASVLVVVPVHLVAQWRTELERKFFIEESARVRVVSETELLVDTATVQVPSMLVIDEAHRSALGAFSSEPTERHLYEVLRDLSCRTPRLLLLSATPVLHNEDGFLAMLHLLDPVAYELGDREAFRRRVHERQMVAEAVADLSDDASLLFAEEAIDRLLSAFSDDARLVELADAARSSLPLSVNDANRQRAIPRLRRHLGEMYRLHRRLLRTRRDDPRVRLLLPHRTAPIVLTYEDPAREEACEVLEAWRRMCVDQHSSANRTDLAQLLSGLVQAALSHPRVLIQQVQQRLILLGTPIPVTLPAHGQLLGVPLAFDEEKAFWLERLPTLRQLAELDDRASRLAEWLHAESSVRKVVVFCDAHEAADIVFSALVASLGKEKVVRHAPGKEAERLFEERESVRAIVCDRAAEEGLNLQRVGATVVHYDLPFEATRVEQRIGRVDRIEASRHVRNVVLTSGSRFEREWLTCLVDGICVFQRSTAALQYMLVESASRLRTALLEGGASAIDAETVRLLDPKDGLEAELRRIRSQESLDAVDELAEEDRAFFEGLADADAQAESEGPGAFDGWLVKRLQFAREQDGDAVQYTHLSGDYRQTLVPIGDAVAHFHALLDRRMQIRRRKGELPFAPGTFSRTAAERQAIPLLRVGHPFVASVEALVRSDDRGAAFAMWRVVPGLKETRLFLRFDFVIEANLSLVSELVNENFGLVESLQRRVAASFPVQHRTVWLDGELRELRQGTPLLARLERPYRPVREGGLDVNLRPDRWPFVDLVAPVGDWEGLCLRARRCAEERIRRDAQFTAFCRTKAERVLARAAEAADMFRNRLPRLIGAQRVREEETAQFEEDIARGIAEGISNPVFRVDAAGAVFLSGSPLSQSKP